MSDLRKAAEMAIEAMIDGDSHKRAEAIIELRQALALPEQEPVAWMHDEKDGSNVIFFNKDDKENWGYCEHCTPLYIAPPKREWIGLTDEEILDIADSFGSFQYGDAQGHKRLDFAKSIEAKLKDKNR